MLNPVTSWGTFSDPLEFSLKSPCSNLVTCIKATQTYREGEPGPQTVQDS